MNSNIKTLKKACQELGITFLDRHPNGNLVEVIINDVSFVFSNWSTPLNPQSVMQMCQDKDYFYQYFQGVISMPETLSFLDPYCSEKYQHYLNNPTISDILNSIESNFQYPVIAKKNRGSYGRNVFKVGNRKELEQRLIHIFNRNSAEYDYVCCIQEYIEIQHEYRAIFLNGQLIFLYEKSLEDASFVGNLSPLHWAGAKAKLQTDEDLKARISQFCAPLFQRLMIPFCGLDIVCDRHQNLYLIEANSSPGFDHILSAGDNGMVLQTYKLILIELQQQCHLTKSLSSQIPVHPVRSD